MTVNNHPKSDSGRYFYHVKCENKLATKVDSLLSAVR